MVRDYEPVVTRTEEYYSAWTEDNRVASQGDSPEHAEQMLAEAVELLDEGGRPVCDSDLKDFDLDPDDLDTKPLPDDFEQYPSDKASTSPQKIATVLMQHNFRPVGRSENHLKFIIQQGASYEHIVIPMHSFEVEPMAVGHISGVCGEPDRPPRFIGWVEETHPG